MARDNPARRTSSRRTGLDTAAAALAAAAVFSAMNAFAAPSLGPTPVSLSCAASMPARLTATQPAILTLTIRNTGAQTAHLLRRNTPLEGWLADSLEVARDGKPIAYSGAMAKRMPPDATEYLRLAPGKSYRFRARLQGAYDVRAAGHYHVRWSGRLLDAYTGTRPPDPAQLTAFELHCPVVEFVRSTL